MLAVGILLIEPRTQKRQFLAEKALQNAAEVEAAYGGQLPDAGARAAFPRFSLRMLTVIQVPLMMSGKGLERHQVAKEKRRLRKRKNTKTRSC